MAKSAHFKFAKLTLRDFHPKKLNSTRSNDTRQIYWGEGEE